MRIFTVPIVFSLSLAVEIFAISLIPWVVLRRKEPSSTVAWILALLFLPGLGATLFLLFGRDRVRLPVQWKRDADRELHAIAASRPNASIAPPPRDAYEAELARIP